MASIQRFLLLQELNTESSQEDPEPLEQSDGGHNTDYAVQFVDVTIEAANEEIILQDVNLEIQQSSITMVSGPIGCGKTTLLRAILREMKPKSGRISVAFTVAAYCAQTTWVPALTIRQIILAGCSYVLERYRDVLVACCLDADLLLWPDGDQTSARTLGFRFTRSLKQRLVSFSDFIGL